MQREEPREEETHNSWFCAAHTAPPRRKRESTTMPMWKQTQPRRRPGEDKAKDSTEWNTRRCQECCLSLSRFDILCLKKKCKKQTLIERLGVNSQSVSHRTEVTPDSFLPQKHVLQLTLKPGSLSIQSAEPRVQHDLFQRDQVEFRSLFISTGIHRWIPTSNHFGRAGGDSQKTFINTARFLFFAEA